MQWDGAGSGRLGRERLLEDGADAVLRRIWVYDERLTHPRMPENWI